MKKTLLIILLIVLLLFVLLVALRFRVQKRGRRWQRWQEFRQETPSVVATPTLFPSPVVSPQEAGTQTSVDQDLEEIDKLLEGLDPQKDFADIPDKDLSL